LERSACQSLVDDRYWRSLRQDHYPLVGLGDRLLARLSGIAAHIFGAVNRIANNLVSPAYITARILLDGDLHRWRKMTKSQS
jgi:hypothetical protein